MARKRLGFKKSLSDTLRGNDAAMRFYCGGDAPAEVLNNLPPKRERAAPRKLEAPVVAAISELLAVHPKVLLAVRQNSGQASYEAKSGKYAPVAFYRILTHGGTVTITDFWGILRDGRLLAVEAKAPPFSAPRNDREVRQANFLALVRNCGGVALFATSADDVAEALK